MNDIRALCNLASHTISFVFNTYLYLYLLIVAVQYFSNCILLDLSLIRELKNNLRVVIDSCKLFLFQH